MRTPKVVVIGSGIGGLVAALELGAWGFDVQVIEAHETLGGKIRALPVGKGQEIDSGPTVFTMRRVFDDLFDACGLSFEDSVKLEPLNLLARHAWHNGGELDLFANKEQTADAISAFATPGEGRRYLRFCRQAARTFETLETTYMRARRPNVLELVARIGRSDPVGLTAIHPFRTLWAELSRYFDDHRLRQLFGRYATYCGASPYAAPGTLMLIAHAEQQGVWLIKGGMFRLVAEIARAAERSGVKFICGCKVEEILTDQSRASGVRLSTGEKIPADAVVFNGDASALGAGLLGQGASRSISAIAPSRRSQSAITLSFVAEAEGFELAPHTVFFGSDYESEFDDVFHEGRLPRKPTVYVHAPDRPHDGGPPRQREERLFMLINAPANGDTRKYTNEDLEQCEARASELMSRCGLRLRRFSGNRVWTTPEHFARMFPGTGGALYGLAPHGWRSSFQRHGSRSPLPRLYLAGGSVHPGSGVPMAALSGRLAAASVIQDCRSTTGSHRAAIAGGTLMA